MKTGRHVISTTLTTIGGFIPLLFAGGSFWPPLAIVIAGGVGGATILATLFIPSIYVLVRPWVEWNSTIETTPERSLLHPRSSPLDFREELPQTLVAADIQGGQGSCRDCKLPTQSRMKPSLPRRAPDTLPTRSSRPSQEGE